MWGNLVMAPTDDLGGAGGGGSSLLTTSGAGGGSGASQGGSNPGNSAAGGNSAPGNAGTGTPPTQSAPQDWRMALPQELQEDVSLRKFSDISALAAGYINAQKLIGADKIAIPGKQASDEDWINVYKKLGLPEDIKDYGLQFKEGATLDENFVSAFKDIAHKAGILPKQAQALADWFSEANLQAETNYVEEIKVKQTEALNNLKQEWGKAYDAKLARAQNVLKTVGDKELIQYLDDSGLGNDTRLIKLLAGIGEKFMKEDTIIPGQSGTGGSLSPVEAKKRANDIMADFKHPYHLKDHPNHKQAVQEVQNLFQMIYSE